LILLVVVDVVVVGATVVLVDVVVGSGNGAVDVVVLSVVFPAHAAATRRSTSPSRRIATLPCRDVSERIGTFPPMTLTATHLATLTALADDRHAEVDDGLLAELRAWGLVMPGSTELTGTGWRYLGQAGGGLLE
jgi:hypothetical protein